MRPFARSRCDGPFPAWSRFWALRVLMSLAMYLSFVSGHRRRAGRAHAWDWRGRDLRKEPELQRARAFSTRVAAAQALDEQRAERIRAVDAADGLAEDLRDRELGDLPAVPRVLAQRDRVRDDHFL